MRRAIPKSVLSISLVASIATAFAGVAAGVLGPPVQASAFSPFPADCHGAPQNGTLYVGSEVEPWIDANPANPANLIGVYQQDRFSSGGASGLGTSVSTNGGASWIRLPLAAEPKFSRCMGAAAGSVGDYERATDPWVSFAPNGTAHQISLSFNDTRDLANAVLVSRSTNGGMTWSPPIELIRDADPNVFNDKETITADPTNSNYVYAVWDRLVFPVERARGSSFLAAGAFLGPTWFARSTNGGVSWEPARPIFDPGRNDQTIGNQIVVMPDGDLVNGTTVFRNDSKVGRKFGYLSVLRSADKGVTWSGEIPISQLGTVEIHDPETGALVRTGDIIPQIAADERPGTDNVYMIWQDARFTGFQRDQIAFSKSTDGGLTWSAPVRINNRRFETQAFTASIRVDAAGNIGVVYHDFRNNDLGDAALETDVWLLRSADGGATWREERVTPTPFDMRAAPVARGYFTGDYVGLASVGTAFHPFWSASAFDADGTDAFGAVATAPFGGEVIVPDGAPAGITARDFPAQRGKPTPR